jgi:hypothetical protein
MPQGGPLREPKFAERYFKPAARAVGLPAALRVHDLRHTCASLLIREGASIKAVQHHLGHKSASITLDRYGTCSRRSWTIWPAAWTGCTRRLLCTQRVPTPRWPPLGKGKGLVGDQALLVEVGRLELPCLVIRAYWPHAVPMPESGR